MSVRLCMQLLACGYACPGRARIIQPTCRRLVVVYSFFLLCSVFISASACAVDSAGLRHL